MKVWFETCLRGFPGLTSEDCVPTFEAMISLTQQAVQKIQSLEEGISEEGKFLRIFVEPGGCSGLEYGMSFDLRKEEDELLESSGVRVLMDPTSLSYLDGSEVDFDDGLNGKGFEIRNPNAETTCGCGKSFN
jgi:iron-sulfur cluster assembly protein/iron-sulfur cluster insertion protein